MENILLLSDSYKVSHYKQYPEKTEVVYSYFESRGGEFPKTKFFGLQYFIKKYLVGEVVTEEKIEEAKEIYSQHFNNPDLFYEEGWRYILEHHQGRLPVKIKAVPEGTLVENHNVLMTIENTDPKCFWLTNYLETLLVQVWYPTTVATQSYYIREMIKKALEETGDVSGIDFKLHDFGFRGVSSVESAGLGGAAHLTNFMGTDTVAGLVMANKYYNAGVVGYNIPASEHSTITSWGKDNEDKAMENMLDSYPTGLVACVSDSYDIYNACKNIWGDKLKDKILNRDGCLVIRPDSGNPEIVIENLLNILADRFGYSINDKGYRVLNEKVRLIQGDGVNYNSIKSILLMMKQEKWSADNIAFGMGGALLQQLNRDTQKFAFKCSAIKINGEWKPVWKDPVTDKGKMSKKGRLALVEVDQNSYSTVPKEISGKPDLLKTVFKNGKIMKEYDWNEIKSNGLPKTKQLTEVRQ